MFVDFFIKRPVFAIVSALIIVLVGAVSAFTLPIAQYPDIAPPQVVVKATYTGASAEVVESAVTVPLEQEINGVEGMKYITSTSGNDGTSTITVTFNLTRDIDLAAVDVQNRIKAAEGRLPEEVQRTGVTVTKTSTQLLLAVALYSENDEYDNIYISNYADLFLKDALRRVSGVGEVRFYGERKYAMRLWLDPNRLAVRDLTAADVVRALQEQNAQVPAGQLGQPPTSGNQPYQFSVRALGRLTDPKAFGDLIVKSDADGTLVKLKDVGRTELGAEDYSILVRFNGKSAVGIGVSLRPGANALDAAREARAELERLAAQFPPGLQYAIALDTTTFVEESMHEVLKSLLEAIVLVVLIIFIFLQDWKSTLIPSITIPVSLIGTFLFTKLLGFSINTLTLFGLVLATGLVVDDAIIVVENIARFIHDKGMPPQKAASAAMQEITGAVIATSLVLAAVFVPVAFFPGTTGQLYQQFALTITFSIAVSTFNALTLSPTLSALLLRQEGERQAWFFRLTNRFLIGLQNSYQRSLRHLMQLKTVMVFFFVVSLALTYWIFRQVPTGFVPTEDQAYFVVTVQAPEGSSLDYTDNMMQQVEQELLKIPEITGVFADAGFTYTGSAANQATIYVTLKPVSERKKPEQSVNAIMTKLSEPFGKMIGATVVSYPAPAVQGVGNFGGFQFELQEQANRGFDTLAQATSTIVSRGNTAPELQNLYSSFSANNPQLIVEIERERAKALQVSLEDIFSTLQVFLGSQYVNDFDYLGRIYRVYVQADQPFRASPKDINRFYVRSQAGAMIPLSNLVEITETTAPQQISHYNLFRSTEINGSPAAGYSSGETIAAMQSLADEILPKGMSYEWSGLSSEQIEAGSQVMIIFVLGIIFVFLVLAAQYENFFNPLIILLAVPLATLGALLFQLMRGLENDIFCQIGLVMLIGMASKNSILIVEFANQLRETGLSTTKAAIEAAQTRLRPILMTSIATLLGILPLVTASGGGALSRQSLGTAVFGGMIVSTFLSLFVVPVLYVVITTLRDRMQHRPLAEHPLPDR